MFSNKNYLRNPEYLLQKSDRRITFSRRQFLGMLPLVFFIPNKKQCSLENPMLAFRINMGKGTINARSFENKMAGINIALSTEEFLLKFDNGETVSSGSMELKSGLRNQNLIELYFSDNSDLEVRVRYMLSKQSHYLRKQISVRQNSKPARRLLVANLDNWQGVRGEWNSMPPDPLPCGSYPVYCDNLWAGIEFPVAFNEHDSNGFILRSRPGGVSIGAEWIDLNSTVIGVAETGKVRNSFLNYIEDIRVAQPRMVACYNSWWTLPKVVKQIDNLSLIKELKAGLYEQHGVFFDFITTDMGWSNPQSIWEIDRSILPQGFDDIRIIVESAGGKLGLWMSPSEIYPPVCDYEWAEKNGYHVLRPYPDNLPEKKRIPFKKGLSLADPKYRSEAKEQIKRLIRENNIGHIKYDGFVAIEYLSHHDLLPDDDSAEPLAHYSLELIKASKEANPGLVTEPTYMNSIYNYISPWIIKYSDTVWGNAEDVIVGIGPAPDYRESHTNAREYMIFKSLDQIWLPQNALQYFDITHVDEHDGFPNHAAMAFGRGRFFISTYLNPKLMDEDDWRIYAGLLSWARKNTDILHNTHVVQSRVELGEPYIYAHWLKTRGILAVRNPSNENREFLLDLGKTNAPAELSDAVCYTQYPYRRGIAAGLNAKSRITLNMAPWELLFLEIVVHSQLKETVAIGARWYRESDGTTSIIPETGVENVRLYEPGKGVQNIPVISRKPEKPNGVINSLSVNKVPDDQWLSVKQRTYALFAFEYPTELTSETIGNLKERKWGNVKWRKNPTINFEIKCSVSVPLNCSGKVLLLIEFPGREHCPVSCDGWADDSPATLEEKSSEEHIGFFQWKGDLRPYESEWKWYICPVGSGSHQIRFNGIAGHANPRFGLWIWTENELGDLTQHVSIQCSDPAMPQYRDYIERQGVCLLPPKTIST